MRLHHKALIILTVACLAGMQVVFPATRGWAVLKPTEVLVVANRKAPDSENLARYYMRKRGVPEENLLLLEVSTQERCTRKEFDSALAAPVRSHLQRRPGARSIRCLVLMYGLPLKVSGTPPSQAERAMLRDLNQALEKIMLRLHADLEERSRLEKRKIEIQVELKKQKLMLDRGASVDSELALVKSGHFELSMWLENPYYLPEQKKIKEGLALKKKDVLMVSRLDGPDPDTVKRVIDESLEVEKRGLTGKAYFDARWPRAQDNELTGYKIYDVSIHLAAQALGDQWIMPVVLEQTEQLFQEGECPQAALYCGWYRLGHYLDAFEWQPGAVGYHIASKECSTLKGNSHVWCKRMLEDGIAATLGPVDEPYVQAFPLPEVFFKTLLDGYWSLAECYLLSIPSWSWKMVLVGDPLYRPFKKQQQKSSRACIQKLEVWGQVQEQ